MTFFLSTLISKEFPNLLRREFWRQLHIPVAKMNLSLELLSDLSLGNRDCIKSGGLTPSPRAAPGSGWQSHILIDRFFSPDTRDCN